MSIIYSEELYFELQRKKNIIFTIQLITLNDAITFQRNGNCGQQNIFFSEHTWELTPPSHTPKMSKSYHSCSVNLNGKNPRLINLREEHIFFPHKFSEHAWKLYLH